LQIGTTDRRFHFLNLHKYGRSGCLLCHIWADAEWGEVHQKLTDAQIVSEVVAALRIIYPRTPTRHTETYGREGATDGVFVTDPVQTKVTRWALDPFALGAYSELQDPSASERDRDVYARSEGRLLFAGEGAAPGMVGAQCTHGAVLSGVAAAVNLLATVAEHQQQSRGSDGTASTAAAGALKLPPTKAAAIGSLLSRHGPLSLDVAAVVECLAQPSSFVAAAMARQSPSVSPKRRRDETDGEDLGSDVEESSM